MSKKYYACEAGDVPEDRAKIVKVKSLSVGVFKLKDGFYALLNVCPHRGAALCEGPKCGTAKATDSNEFVYDRAGEIVRCAWHGWEFDIRTGAFLVDPTTKARTIPVSREADALYLHI